MASSVLKSDSNLLMDAKVMGDRWNFTLAKHIPVGGGKEDGITASD